MIRSHINALKEADKKDEGEDSDAEDAPPEHQTTHTFNNIYLGAPQKRCSIDNVELAHQGDPAFKEFRNRFEKSLNDILRRNNSPVEIKNPKGLSVAAEDFVSHKMISVCWLFSDKVIC